MSYQAELNEARQTLTLSTRVASNYVAMLGAVQPVLIFGGAHLGRKTGFQKTVLDHKYWFAKLYEIVTYNELGYSTHTNAPGFSLHFMKVFYGMYYSALQAYEAKRMKDVPPLWATHFKGPYVKEGERVDTTSPGTVMFCIRTGAIAHIQGDMATALMTAYQTWNPDTPKPKFDDLKDDFITKSKSAFTAAQGSFYIDVNDKSFSPVGPMVGQMGAAYVQALFDIQPSLPVMFQWREDAWAKAAFALRLWDTLSDGQKATLRQLLMSP